MTDLTELADRCEKATGPDERLNAEIVAALNDALLKPYPPQTDFGPGQRWQFWSLDGKHFLGNEAKHPFKVPPFTASIDDAMTLVPEGWRLIDMCETVIEGDLPWYVRLREKRFDVPPGSAHSDGATPALALCAAALRAHAAQVAKPEGSRPAGA